jgi:hypothetical protein
MSELLVGVGTDLEVGTVIEVHNSYVLVKTDKGFEKFSFSQIEAMING